MEIETGINKTQAALLLISRSHPNAVYARIAEDLYEAGEQNRVVRISMFEELPAAVYTREQWEAALNSLDDVGKYGLPLWEQLDNVGDFLDAIDYSGHFNTHAEEWRVPDGLDRDGLVMVATAMLDRYGLASDFHGMEIPDVCDQISRAALNVGENSNAEWLIENHSLPELVSMMGEPENEEHSDVKKALYACAGCDIKEWLDSITEMGCDLAVKYGA